MKIKLNIFRSQKLKRISLITGSFGLLLILVSFGEIRHKRQDVKKISVKITDSLSSGFISRADVMAALAADGIDEISGRKASDINLREVEQRIMQNVFVKDVQSHIDMQGQLNINIEQRIPLVRIQAPGHNYYLDRSCQQMPLSRQFTAHVPIATTSFEHFSTRPDPAMNIMDTCLYIFVNTISKDSFMKALTGQITINENNEFTISPRLGEFDIDMGDTSALENKILRLTSFYKQTLPIAGWDRYKKISVKYKNQIITNR